MSHYSAPSILRHGLTSNRTGRAPGAIRTETSLRVVIRRGRSRIVDASMAEQLTALCKAGARPQKVGRKAVAEKMAPSCGMPRRLSRASVVAAR
ncbi:hypothetical protein [Sinorhizobium alkalisoli]|uniref:Uncharacterized protein n=1 Tax=Sinorhizobium alkalisoli TaxID=1752398 RepID=A0A1E3VE05_9HYPH|nr:hypothetical protein [Sinorhizobium alkalisoli]ODR91765.1 hypothetical protein A8M32_08590 [Sinorhizobium alkalisoli]